MICSNLCINSICNKRKCNTKFCLNNCSKRGREIMQLKHKDNKRKATAIALSQHLFFFLWIHSHHTHEVFEPKYLNYMMGWFESSLVPRVEVPSKCATNTRKPNFESISLHNFNQSSQESSCFWGETYMPWIWYPNLHVKKPLAISEASCSTTLTTPLTPGHKGFEKPDCSSTAAILYPLSPLPSINPYLPSSSSTSITMMDSLFAPIALSPPVCNTWNNTGERLGVKLCPHSGHGQNSHWFTKQLIQFWVKAKNKIWILLILYHLMPELWNPSWLPMGIRMLVKSYLIPSHYV